MDKFINLKIITEQNGQTLIETLVAVFMLVMGVSAALGLAIYALSTSTGITKQIIATGLAREGIEAVKDMRDTNWLQQTTIDTNCYDFTSTPVGQPDASCYKNWLGDKNLQITPYCLNPKKNQGVGNCQGGDSSDNYFLSSDETKTTAAYWILTNDKNNNFNFGLQYDPINANNQGFYYSPNGGTPCQNGVNMSDYCRKIILTLDFTAPYNHPSPPPNSYDDSDIGPMLKVQSQVWWVDKKCPRATDFSQASPTCRLELDYYLTNWKNY